MEIVITFILFFFAAAVSFFIPGRVVLHILRVELEGWHGFFLSWVVGLCLFLLFSYLFAWTGFPYLVLALPVASLIYGFFNKQVFKTVSFKKIDLLSVVIFFTGSLFFVSTTFFSGMQTDKGLKFLGINGMDGVMHVANIKNLLIFFPPTHAGLAGIELKGYHYFYDFLLSRFSLFYRFTPEDLYFRLFPLFVSFSYGGAFIFLASFLTKDFIKRRLILFLAYFSQSFAFFVPLFLFGSIWSIERPELVQPISLLVNPSIVLTLALLVTGLALLPKVKESGRYAVIVGLMLGILTQTKVYSGLIGIATLLIFSLFLFLKERKIYVNYIYATFLTGFLTVITFFPNNFGVGSLVFAPLLIYHNYMEHTALSPLHWEIKRTIYAEHNNALRLIQLYGEAFIMFWVINLGIRILPVLYIKRLLKRKFWNYDYNIVLLTSIFVPILIASFFVQSVSVFDIKQLLWIVLPLICIPTGLLLGEIFQSKYKFIIGFCIVILSMGVFHSLEFVSPYLLSLKKSAVSDNDLLLYKQVAEIVPQKSFIVSLPTHTNVTPLVSAMTGRSVYFEWEVAQYSLHKIFDERQNNLKHLQSTLVACNVNEVKKQMSTLNSKYLLSAYGNDCLASSSAILKHVDGETMSFYVFK